MEKGEGNHNQEILGPPLNRLQLRGLNVINNAETMTTQLDLSTQLKIREVAWGKSMDTNGYRISIAIMVSSCAWR